MRNTTFKVGDTVKITGRTGDADRVFGLTGKVVKDTYAPDAYTVQFPGFTRGWRPNSGAEKDHWNVSAANMMLIPANPFKVGDEVRVPEYKHLHGIVTAVGYTNKGRPLADAVCYGENFWDHAEDLVLVKAAPIPAPSKGHIVMVLDANGYPQPAKRPKVHASYHAATVEAQRLSKLHLGERFAVYSHQGTAQTTEQTRTVTEQVTGYTLA